MIVLYVFHLIIFPFIVQLLTIPLLFVADVIEHLLTKGEKNNENKRSD